MSAVDLNKKIFVAGHRGMVGSAIVRKLNDLGFTNIITATRGELDLEEQDKVEDFFKEQMPSYVFLAAAKVGGIKANSEQPADFLFRNLDIQSNVIQSAFVNGVKKLLFLGSSCIYPRECPQPIKEEYLLTGPLEKTNEAYAIAKIAGIKMCDALRKQHGFNAISLMPTNLYGPNDNYDLNSSHVIPALLRKFHQAKVDGSSPVEVWGSGKPLREFLHVDDLADAAVFAMQNYNAEGPLNVGCGKDLSIKELAETIGKIVGYEGKIQFNTNMPEGTPRKVLDVSKINSLGWTASIELEDGLQSTYKEFLTNHRN